VRERQGMRRAIPGHPFLGQEPGCTIRYREPLGCLGGRGERGELDAAEMDETLRRLRNLSESGGMAVGIVLPIGVTLGTMPWCGTPRHGSPRGCAERKRGGHKGGNQRSDQGHHALNVVAEPPGCKGNAISRLAPADGGAALPVSPPQSSSSAGLLVGSTIVPERRSDRRAGTP
jgi:hypothetical protein